MRMLLVSTYGKEAKAHEDKVDLVYRALMPSRRRRLVLIFVACALGGFVAYTQYSVVNWSGGASVIILLALLAGISTLWSP